MVHLALPFLPPRGRRLRLELTVLMALLSLLLTLGVWHQSKESAVEKAQALFSLRVEDLAQAMVLRMADYEQVLRGARGLVAANHAIEAHQWREYVRELKNGPLYPGLQNFALLRVIEAADVDQFAKSLGRDFKTAGFAAKINRRLDRHIVLTYLEPSDSDESLAVGQDLAEEPNLSTALGQACDSGLAAATAPALPFDVRDGRSGAFSLYMPIFKPGLPLNSVNDRRRALWGYVAGSVQIDRMIDGVMAELQREISEDLSGSMVFAIADMTEPATPLPLYDGGLEKVKLQSDSFSKTIAIAVSGRQWMIESVSALSLRARRANDMPGIWTRAVALFGVLLTGLTYALGVILENRSNLRQAYARLAEREADLDRLAHSDPLTGVANRRHFFVVGATEWMRAKRHGRALSVLMIDVDYFKSVNDTHGHGVGDDTLKQLTTSFRTILRDCDLLARMGGEEFAVLLVEVDPKAVKVVAERLRHAAADLSVATGEGGHLSVTVSIGAANMSRDDLSLDDLVRRADRALYAAKTGGRNQVIVSEPEEFPLLALVGLSEAES
jgi:diguanylate cyclase (GGDEF)-like protein